MWDIRERISCGALLSTKGGRPPIRDTKKAAFSRPPFLKAGLPPIRDILERGFFCSLRSQVRRARERDREGALFGVRSGWAGHMGTARGIVHIPAQLCMVASQALRFIELWNVPTDRLFKQQACQV